MENNRPWHLPAPAGTVATRLCIVSDVEHCSHLPGNPVARLRGLLAGNTMPCVLESLFPEVRALAYLSAAGAAPSRADWLAARVMVFALSHLELAHDELALMDAVNLRLARLSRKLATDCPPVRSFALFGGARQWRTHGNTACLLACLDSPVAQSLALRHALAPRLAGLRSSMRAAGF